MNRSRRRVAVISWAITAGVLYVAGGIAGVAPAIADPATADENPRAGDVSSSASRHSNAPSRSHHGRQPVPGDATASYRNRYDGRATIPGLRGADTDESTEATEPAEWPWHWPCHTVWPIWPVPIPARANIQSVVGVGPTVQPVPPLAQFPGLAEPLLPGFALQRMRGTTDSDIRIAQQEPASAPPPIGRQGTPPGLPPEAAPLAGSIKPPAAPMPQRPNTGPRPPDAVRLGYPEYLRDADFAEVAVVALPGLGGIIAIAALGGFLGHRQAKAGSVLRAAGTARFLQ